MVAKYFQPTRLDVSCWDNSACSKKSTLWPALTARTDTVDGVEKMEKEGKEVRKTEQPGRTGARERRKAAEKCQERSNFM